MTQAVIELYPATLKADVPGDGSANEEYIKIATQFGFTRLLGQEATARSEGRLWCLRHQRTPLSDEELRLWREYLPTSYWSKPEKAVDPVQGNLPRSFADYEFHEGVPLSVLQRMEKLGHLFDVLEIRTPEAGADPVLWGHIISPDGQREIHPLARWAESDANFIPGVDELRKVLRARRGFLGFSVSSVPDALLSVIAFAIIGAFSAGLAPLVLSYVIPSIPAGTVLTLTGTALGALLAVANITLQRRRMQAFRMSDPQLARFV